MYFLTSTANCRNRDKEYSSNKYLTEFLTSKTIPISLLISQNNNSLTYVDYVSITPFLWFPVHWKWVDMMKDDGCDDTIFVDIGSSYKRWSGGSNWRYCFRATGYPDLFFFFCSLLVTSITCTTFQVLHESLVTFIFNVAWQGNS